MENSTERKQKEVPEYASERADKQSQTNTEKTLVVLVVSESKSSNFTPAIVCRHNPCMLASVTKAEQNPESTPNLMDAHNVKSEV